MYTRIVVWPYQIGSTSARALAYELNALRVFSHGKYRAKPRDVIVNWGNPRCPNWWNLAAASQTLNLPQYVENASNKVSTFRHLGELSGLDWTTEQQIASDWFGNPPYPRKINACVCRTLTRAHSGRGIVLARSPAELRAAPLYVRYKPKQTEYRVHIWLGQILDIQEKRRRNNPTNTDKYIRNHANGWVFCRDNVQAPTQVLDISLLTVGQLKLQFGAVDIGWHQDYGHAVYEVNTAPGLEGQTLKSYADAIRQTISVL